MKPILASKLISELEQFVEAIDEVLAAHNTAYTEETNGLLENGLPTNGERHAVLTLSRLLAEYHEKGSPGDGFMAAESAHAFLEWARKKKPEIEFDPQYDEFILRLLFNTFPRKTVKAIEDARGYLAYKLAYQNGHLDRLLAEFENGRLPIGEKQLNWRPREGCDRDDETIVLPWSHRLGIAVDALKLSKRTTANRKPARTTHNTTSRRKSFKVPATAGHNDVESSPNMTDARDSPMTLNIATAFVIEAFDAQRQFPTQRERKAVLAIGKMLAEHHKQSQKPKEPILVQDEKTFADWARQADPIARKSGEYCKFILALFFKCFEGQLSNVEVKETGFSAYQRACETKTLHEHLSAFKCDDPWVSIGIPRWDLKEASWLPHLLREYRLKVARDRLDSMVESVDETSPFIITYVECNSAADYIKNEVMKDSIYQRRNLLAAILKRLLDGPGHVHVRFGSKFELYYSEVAGTFFNSRNGKPFTPTELKYLFCGIAWQEYIGSSSSGTKTGDQLKDVFRIAREKGWELEKKVFDNYKKAFNRSRNSFLKDAVKEFYHRKMSLADLLNEVNQIESVNRGRKSNKE